MGRGVGLTVLPEQGIPLGNRDVVDEHARGGN
jgi:hypothetical protein